MTASAAFESLSGSGDDFQQVVALCEALHDYCLIGGLAITCYAEPIYTMDADFALATVEFDPLRQRLAALGFGIEDHPRSLNALRPGSQLHIQFTKDARYASFPARADIGETLGSAFGSRRSSISCKPKSGRGPTRNTASRNARRTNSTWSASRKPIRSSFRNCRRPFAGSSPENGVHTRVLRMTLP